MSKIEAAFFGALGHDAQLRISKAGKQYLRLSVRVGNGDAAQWINVTSFDPDAIAAADKLVKGSRIYCEGSIRLDQWTGQDGLKRHGLSALSWHSRLAAIGRNRPKHSRGVNLQKPKSARVNDDAFHSDGIPF